MIPTPLKVLVDEAVIPLRPEAPERVSTSSELEVEPTLDYSACAQAGNESSTRFPNLAWDV